MDVSELLPMSSLGCC